MKREREIIMMREEGKERKRQRGLNGREGGREGEKYAYVLYKLCVIRS